MIATAVFTLLWLGHAFLSSPLVPLVPYQFPHEEVGRGEEGQGRGESRDTDTVGQRAKNCYKRDQVGKGGHEGTTWRHLH